MAGREPNPSPSSNPAKKKNKMKKKIAKTENSTPKTEKLDRSTPTTAAAASSEKKRKFGQEIDAIFGAVGKAKKSKKTTAQDEQPQQRKCEEKSGEKAAKVMGSSSKKKSMKGGKPFDPSGDAEGRKNRRKTGDGLAIYSVDELGCGNPDAGGTPLCPFDCDCCF